VLALIEFAEESGPGHGRPALRRPAQQRGDKPG
jgi:hypothetical protein